MKKKEKIYVKSFIARSDIRALLFLYGFIISIIY